MTKHDAATDFGADMDYKKLVASVAVHYGVIKIHGQKKNLNQQHSGTLTQRIDPFSDDFNNGIAFFQTENKRFS